VVRVSLGKLQTLNPPQPADHWVPTDDVLGHQTFISTFNRPQIAEGRCGYTGSNKSISIERDSVGKEQLLESLALVESGLHPQVRGARQNAFCERQDALYVEFFELARVTFVGSVAERREMPSDCRCERSAKWSYFSRAKRVRLNTTTKCTRPLFSRQLALSPSS
jgi:hypothetical protein